NDKDILKELSLLLDGEISIINKKDFDSLVAKNYLNKNVKTKTVLDNPTEISESVKYFQKYIFEKDNWHIILLVELKYGDAKIYLSIKKVSKILEQAKNSIKSIKVGKTGYPAVITLEGDTIAHPKLEGVNLFNVKDSNGNPFIQNAIKQRAGIIYYDWKNEGEEVAREKIMLFAEDKNFNSLIMVTSYIEEFDSAKYELRDTLIFIGIISLIVVMIVIFYISNNINKIVSKILEENSKVIVAITNGKLDFRANEKSLDWEFRPILFGLNRVIDTFVKPINLTAEYVERVSRGDTPPKITEEYKGDFNEIKNNLNMLIDANSTITDIAQKISNGDFSIDIKERSGEDKLLISLKKSIQTIKSVENSINQTIIEIQNGNLSFSSDLSIFLGGWRAILKSLNSLTDTFVKPIKTTSEYINRISIGDIPEPIKEEFKGDFNIIKDSINSCILSITTILKGIKRVSNNMVDGKLDDRGNHTLFSGDWANLVLGINSIIDALVKPINVTAEYVDRISKGDIPSKITENYKGDFNEIKNNINELIDTLSNFTSEILFFNKQQISGEIDYHFDVNRFSGCYKDMALGVDKAVHYHIDAIIEMLGVVGEYGQGNLSVELRKFPGKQIVANQMIDKIRENINLLISETKLLINSVKDGKLDERGDENRFNFEFKNIIKGINSIMDEIINPLNIAAEYVDRISKGDIPAKITTSYKGDFNEIKNSLNMLIEIMKNLLGEITNLITFSKNGDLSKRANFKLFQGDWLLMINGINEMIDVIINPILEGTNIIKSLAEGDLSKKVMGNYQGEHAILKNAINLTIDSLKTLIHQIDISSQQVLIGAQQVSDSGQALSQGATEQASSITEITSSIKEIHNQTKKSAKYTKTADEFSNKSKESAQKGNFQMKNLLNSVNEISESSKNISKIIKVIDEIAFQTNLLALNAAVEAARAGKYGKGFAVVAEEVRNLAVRSAKAAKETSEMIENAVKKSEKGAVLAIETAGYLDGIENDATELNKIIKEIAELSMVQEFAISEINSSLTQIEQITQQNTANAEESAAASEELSGQAFELKNTISKFKKA
ncbi:Cache 3/Cache 2 fusion domain-containing protein, partial [bacterium]|nr:Cache 3/Cache 2 fusion domain-containing protein [bacterium]